MSELTYLTSEIRDGFIESYIGDGSHISQDDARALNAEQFDRWLAERDRQVKAEAWDEGYVVGFARGYGDGTQPDERSNPYREETE